MLFPEAPLKSSTWTLMVGRVFVALWLAGATVGTQAPAPDDVRDRSAEVDPIACWWRTSAAAIRIGETFSVVLTCAVIDNDSTIVVPDQSRLEPAILQLPPFEVLDGIHHPDLRTANRRFFQYDYTLRLVSDEVFGEDVELPALAVTYRVRTRTEQGSLVEGLDRTYVLPTTPIRVLSLVPEDAADIRDAAHDTFSAFEARTFRSNALLLIAAVLFALSGAVALWMLVRLAGAFFAQTAGPTGLIGDGVVLRTVGRELQEVQKAREHEGWNEALTGRALAAFRILGSYVLTDRASHIGVTPTRNGHDGQLLVHGVWPSRKRVLVSGSVTPGTIGQALARADLANGRRADLEILQTALARFGAVRYGREARIDETALDESLTRGLALARTLQFTHLWIAKKLAAIVRPVAAQGSQLWSR